jgi:hypothetical protein
VGEVIEKRVETDCCRSQKLLLDAFNCRNFYEFKFELVKFESDLNDENECFNDFKIFDLILSTPKSGKFIELCLEAGASFYKVSQGANSDKQTVNPPFLANLILEVPIGSRLCFTML